MIEVITGFDPIGFEQYGKRFMSTFDQYWCKKSFKLTPYIEESIRHPNERNIETIAPLMAFLDKYKDDDEVKGLEPKQCWKGRDIEKGYCYKTDAYKFNRIPFYIADALSKTESEYLLWIDGDTYAFNPINKHTILKQLPENKGVAYLGRVKSHTECGFLLFNVSLGRSIIEAWANLYATGDFIELDEWHNSYLFDVILSQAQYGNKGHNMTPNGSGHVWFQSEIGNYIDHIKGFKRKELGYSPERYGKKV